MDLVGVMAAYLPVVLVCTELSREANFIVILIVSTNYISVHLLDNRVFLNKRVSKVEALNTATPRLIAGLERSGFISCPDTGCSDGNF